MPGIPTIRGNAQIVDLNDGLKKSCAVPFCDLMRAAKALKKSKQSKNDAKERPGRLEQP